MNYRDSLKDKSRIVVKIGSSSLVHKNTGYLDLSKLEKLVRVLTNLRNTGKDVVLVSSGAIAVGRKKNRTWKNIINSGKTGVCCNRTSTAYDDVSKAL